jgi:TetR/AcrR family tetracycline transcriptional repressor
MRNTRDDVVAAALGVLDTHGLEFCSMRRVAAALDVQPSALYHHVANKQTLLALMADQIVLEVHGTTPRDFCRSLRAALLSIRDGADVVATASAFRLGASNVESQLTEMVGADGARTLLLYTFGQAQATQTQVQAHELGVLPVAHQPGGDAGDPATLAAQLAQSFERGVEIILAGLEIAAPHKRATGRHARPERASNAPAITARP